ncbi:ribonuclease III domain-containing protein [Methanochimaera problematica]|uniref:ribonuclease III domain-containing protein n=1 Tax=Methanochimaera problematica TaxID=2609417 RepID=UPI0029394434|nr:ribonuclease III domain-containing protein [Methanoplanus sp. FWC-SCC4]
MEKKIGYNFKNREYLIRALTRHSYSKERDLPENDYMDAYATLGDAVIDVIVIKFIIDSGEHEKGSITLKKTNMVNMSSLRKLGEKLDIHENVLWGKGERQQEIWTSGRVLAECMEAIAGAVFLDGGLEVVFEMLKKIDFVD